MRIRGGGYPKDDMMTRGGGGAGYPPKMMTSFMNSPLSTPGTKSNTTGQGGVFVKIRKKGKRVFCRDKKKQRDRS